MNLTEKQLQCVCVLHHQKYSNFLLGKTNNCTRALEKLGKNGLHIKNMQCLFLLFGDFIWYFFFNILATIM